MWSGHGWGLSLTDADAELTWDGVTRALTIDDVTQPELTRSWFRWFLEADGCRYRLHGLRQADAAQVRVGLSQLVERRRRELEQARLASLRASMQPTVEAAVQWNAQVRPTLDEGRRRGRWDRAGGGGRARAKASARRPGHDPVLPP